MRKKTLGKRFGGKKGEGNSWERRDRDSGKKRKKGKQEKERGGRLHGRLGGSCSTGAKEGPTVLNGAGKVKQYFALLVRKDLGPTL